MKIVETWREDAVMSVFNYHFRPREVDPEHYDQKMRFWKEMIENYCEYKGSSSFSIQELKEVFKRKGTSPYCLDTVVNQMIADGNAQDKSTFMMSPRKTWGQWTVDVFISKPVSWTFNKLKERVVGNAINPETVFVSNTAVQNQAKLLQEHVCNVHSYNNIISMDELMKNADDIEGLSKDGILMALQYMIKVDKSVYTEEDQSSNVAGSRHHKLLMKFYMPGKRVEPITELERAVYNLESTERFLIETIDKKENDLNKILVQVRNCLKDGKKQLAKTYLRKKHMLENDLTKTVNTLDNIQALLQRVHNSKSDKDILQTYKMGAEGIKHVFAESGMNIDNVYDVIEDMKEVFENEEELQNAISSPLRGTYDVDDSMLEAELMDLINDNNGEAAKVPQAVAAENGKTDFNVMDLEMRLKRLRGELPEMALPTTPTSPISKIHRPLNQL